jgi:hypothetical protein
VWRNKRVTEQTPSREGIVAAADASGSQADESLKLSKILEHILAAPTSEEREAQLRRFKEVISTTTSFMQSSEDIHRAQHRREVESLTLKHRQCVEMECLMTALALNVESARHQQKLEADGKVEEQKFKYQGLYTLDKVQSDTLKKEKWALYTWLCFSALAITGGLIWLVGGASGVGLFALGGGMGALAVAAFGVYSVVDRGLPLLIGMGTVGAALLTAGLLVNEQATEARHILLLGAGLLLFSSLGLTIRLIGARK